MNGEHKTKQKRKLQKRLNKALKKAKQRKVPKDSGEADPQRSSETPQNENGMEWEVEETAQAFVALALRPKPA